MSKPPGPIAKDEKVMLQKDELKYRLEETTVKHDTLFAKISQDNTDPAKTTKKVVVIL